MPGIEKLTKRQIADAKPGQRLGDGGGLFLHCREGGAKYWSLQATIKAVHGPGKRVEVGIGSFADISADEARKLAKTARFAAKQGKDPRSVLKHGTMETAKTFKQVCELAFEARKAELKGGGTAGRWMSPVEIHVMPKIGERRIDGLTQHDLVDVLKPIWHTKADTARKAMNRINIVMQYAAAMDLDVDIQAVEKAKALLGKTRHVAKKIPSMPWANVPDFYGTLGAETVELALRLLILTGHRSTPVRFAHVDQFDLESKVWTVPGETMKGQKGKTSEFRVPLSAEAVAVVKLAMAGARDGYLFPGMKKGVISDMSMGKRMDRAKLEARPHGFRSSLRTWLSECTDASFEVAETINQHSTGSHVVDAYRRTDFLEKRAPLMERWANHVTGGTGAAVKLAV